MVLTTGPWQHEWTGICRGCVREAMTRAAAIAMAVAGPAADSCKILNLRQQTIVHADHRDLSPEILAMFYFSFARARWASSGMHPRVR